MTRETPEQRWRDWREVSMQTRAADEVAAQRHAAGEHPADIDDARALFTPLDERERESLVGAVFEGLGLELPGFEQTPTPEGLPEVEQTPGTQASETQAPATQALDARQLHELEAVCDIAGAREPRESSRAQRWFTPLAAAVALLTCGSLVARQLMSTEAPGADPSRASPEQERGAIASLVASTVPLPVYELETPRAIPALRAPPSPATSTSLEARYRDEGSFEWTLRPHERVHGPLSLQILARDELGTRMIDCEGLRAQCAVSWDKSGTGAVRISGPVSALRFGPGNVRVELHLTRERVCDPEDLVHEHGYTRVLSLDVTIETPHPER